MNKYQKALVDVKKNCMLTLKERSVDALQELVERATHQEIVKEQDICPASTLEHHRPMGYEQGFKNYYYYYCPVCGKRIDENYDNYCWNCGQALGK